MTEALTIYNVAGTINLMSGGSQTGAGYFSDFTPSIGPGRDPDSTTTDTFPMYVNGTSRADLASKINALQQYFEQARVWQDTGTGPRTFVNWQPEGYAAGRRSEIVFGNYALRDGFKTQFSGTATHRALIDVEITRRNWWEGAETVITRTSENSSGRMYNNGDRSGTAASNTLRINYCDVDPANILGDLDAPLLIQMGPTGVYSSDPEWIMVSCAKSVSRSTYGTAEAGWCETITGGTAVSSADYTNGNYYHKTTTTSPEVLETTNALGVYINTFGNNASNYRFLANMSVGVAGTYRIRPYIYSGTYTYGRAQYVPMTTTFELFDFGNIRFPSFPTEYGPVETATAGIEFGTSGVDVRIDWLHIIRQEWTRIYYGNPGFWGTFVDDALYGKSAYWNITSTYRGADLLAKGAPRQTITPGLWNRFYFHAHSPGSGGVLPKDIYLSPGLIYRPRYLCL